MVFNWDDVSTASPFGGFIDWGALYNLAFLPPPTVDGPIFGAPPQNSYFAEIEKDKNIYDGIPQISFFGEGDL